MDITIYGNTPSKKNSKQIFRTRGRMLIVPSDNYYEWHRQSLKQLHGVQKIEGQVHATLTFFGRDARLFDLTNKAESIMDLLVDAYIIADDNYAVVPKLTIRYGGIDRDNPRCEVFLETLTKKE